MAKQLITTVVSVDGNYLKTPFDKSFSTDSIVIIENTDTGLSGASYILSNGVQYYTNDSIATLIAAANDGAVSMIQASVVNINGYPIATAISVLFPASDAVTIAAVSNDSTIHSVVTFLGKKYYATNTESSLVSAANSGAATTSINEQTNSYTLVLGDADKLILMNKATANTLTVPPNSTTAFPIGTSILVAQKGAGQTTIAAGAGVTINSAGGALKLNVQYSGASLTKVDTNTWYLFGDITT